MWAEHYSDPNVYSSGDQRKHQSSASLVFGWGIHLWPVNSPHKWPVTRKMFPSDDVIMNAQLHSTAHLMYSVAKFCFTYSDILFDSWQVFARILISPWYSDHQSSWSTLFHVMACHLLPNSLLRYCQWYLGVRFFILLVHLSHQAWWCSHRLGHHRQGLSIEPTKTSLTFGANYKTNSFQELHMKGSWEIDRYPGNRFKTLQWKSSLKFTSVQNTDLSNLNNLEHDINRYCKQPAILPWPS